jgi:CubicO group peptidase (beta-lactamase class C family)
MSERASPRLQRRLEQVLIAGCEEARVPGAVALIAGAQGVAAAAAGVLDSESGLTVRPESLFEIGSITKPMTASLVVRAASQGRLSLDDAARMFIPEWRPHDELADVTVRQLLAHTSGLPGDVFLDTGEGPDALARYAEACGGLAPIHPPGASVSYCNSGYALLGRLLEVIHQTSFHTCLTDTLGRVVGASTLEISKGERRADRAVGHAMTAEGVRPIRDVQFPLALAPAGSRTVGSVFDLLAFATLHLEDGRTDQGLHWLSPEWVAAMRVLHARAPEGDWQYVGRGLGWELFPSRDSVVFGHDGRTAGQTAFLRILPENGTVFALLTNGGIAQTLFRRVAEEFNLELAGLELAVPAASRPASGRAELCAGVFVTPAQRHTVVAGSAGELLVHTAPAGEAALGQARSILLKPFSDRVFAQFDEGGSPSPVIFTDDDPFGRPQAMHIGQRRAVRWQDPAG